MKNFRDFLTETFGNSTSNRVMKTAQLRYKKRNAMTGKHDQRIKSTVTNTVFRENKMKSFGEFLSEDRVTYGWTTKRQKDGYDWEVHKWEYGKDKKSIHSGKSDSRQAAIQAAKDSHKPYIKKAKKKK